MRAGFKMLQYIPMKPIEALKYPKIWIWDATRGQWRKGRAK